MATAITIQKRPLPSTDDTALQWVQRRFYKKTARGKVQKIIRERYLRDDILCGRQGCDLCNVEASIGQSQQLESGTSLQKDGSRSREPRQDYHFLVLDTNVVLHQMDLLESMLGTGFGTPSFVNVIILQTVLDEVRHRSLPLYNRLFALIRDPERHWWIYWNDFSAHTATIRKADESPNDRNDRSIRGAVKWYAAHFSSIKSNDKALRVILLSDDAANIRIAKQDGLYAMSVREYVTMQPNAPQMLDLLASRSLEQPDDAAGEGSKRGALHPSHIEGSALTAAVASGKYLSGFFNASAFNYLEGSVRATSMSKPILLVGREAMNRAIDGDIVAVELLPRDQWKQETNEVLDADVALRNDDGEESDDEGRGKDERVNERANEREEQMAKADHKQEAQPTGKVVGIIKRNWRSYVAHIDSNSVPASAMSSLTPSTLLVIPLDRKIPRVRVRTRQASSLVGQKILVSLDDWKASSRYPDGHFVRALGKVESQEAEQESLLLEHDVPYRPFSQAILNCLPPEGDSWTVPPKDMTHPAWKNRRDFREENICSIDPPGCQDIDDALHAKRLTNGNIEAGVHIADVSYFVKPETPMDKEAASRGTTVYLVDRRIDMLPHLLGTNLCSLRPHVERLAFSAIWELTPDGDIVNVEFYKSVIASKSAFTYEEAQLRKDDKNRKDAITESIRLLNSLAIKLKEKRMKAGALNLASPEVRIHLESAESVGPIDVEQKEMRETNSLVEEFMLLANVAVARRIYEYFPQTAVLRRHMPPPATNFETLREILKKRRGMDLDVSSSGALADSLDKCIDKSNPAFNTLVRIMATRCMLSAEYFCSGSVSAESFGHYGLACDMYTHFTSPIRRMADVLTHRQLSASIEYEPLDPTLHSKTHVENMLNIVNKRHRAAQMAGRASVEYWVGLAIKRKNEEKGGDALNSIKLIEEAYVIRAFRNGVAVFVTSYGLEGLITFPKDCQFNAEEFQVTVPKDVSGFSKDLTLGIFDKCKVEIGVKKDKNTMRSVVAMSLVPT